MDGVQLKKIEQKYVMQTYGRFDVVLEEGKGVVAKDADGKRYIDFASGIGVNALGYCDDAWVQAVTQQAGRLQHVSNLYYTEPMVKLAQHLCEATGMAKVFFGNSGAEANECAVKIARKYSEDKYGKGRTDIITLQNSFHGRTLTTLAATGQEVFHQHFLPLTEGFAYGVANDLDSVRGLVTDKTCGILVEFVQGEGGVNPLDKKFVQALAKLCEERDLLLLADEVQTGMGRTGTLYAYEQYGVTPDVLTTAKGLGGGLPIGACLCGEKLENVLTAGLHGTTYGGNPIACAGANVVLERVTEPGFLEEVRQKGAYLKEKLEQMAGVESVRGLGMMLGVSLTEKKAGDVAKACAKAGLLVLTAKDVVRLLPPLTITKEELDFGLAILEQVMGE